MKNITYNNKNYLGIKEGVVPPAPQYLWINSEDNKLYKFGNTGWEPIRDEVLKGFTAEQIEEILNSIENKVDKEPGKGLSTNDYTNEEKAQVAEVENKANKNGRYLDLAAGYYVGNVELSEEVKSGNLNTNGSLTPSTSSHLCVDISHLSGAEKIAIKTTSNSQYSALWALWQYELPLTGTDISKKVAQGPLCSESQEAIIDLSLYAEKSPKYLYVAIGAEGNSASATLIEGGKRNIAKKFEEVEEKIGKSSVLPNGVYPEMAAGNYTYNLDIPQEVMIGSLNNGGGITASTAVRYLRVDLSKIAHNIVLSVSTTNISANSSLWALFEKPFEDFSWGATQKGKGEPCSVTQSADIDLSKYPTANYLYVSIGSPTNTASVTAPAQTKDINERFKEVEIPVPNIVLPSEIDIAVGDTLNLYHKSMVEACDIDNYQVELLSNVGQSFPRYYTFKPSSSQAGDSYTLTLNLKDSKGTIVRSATTTIVVKSVPTTNEAKNILTLGASMVANGNIAYELKRRLTTTSGDGKPDNPTGIGLSNLSFVGRLMPENADVQQEATGGWAWRDYVSQGRQAYRFQVSGVKSINMGDVYVGGDLTFTITEINVTDGVGNIRCTYTGSGSIPTSGNLTRNKGNGDATIAYSSYASETYNPFYNDGVLDIQHYADLYCNGNIDILIAVCGTNDLFTTRPIVEIMEDVKTFARAYHADFPNGKLILSTLPLPSPIGGMGANYNATKDNYYNIALRMFGFAKGIYDMCKDSEFADWVIDCATLQTFDIDNLYPYTEKPVNNRMPSVKEKIGTNGVHPTVEGYKTIADALYSTVVGLL